MSALPLPLSPACDSSMPVGTLATLDTLGSQPTFGYAPPSEDPAIDARSYGSKVGTQVFAPMATRCRFSPWSGSQRSGPGQPRSSAC